MMAFLSIFGLFPLTLGSYYPRSQLGTSFKPIMTEIFFFVIFLDRYLLHIRISQKLYYFFYYMQNKLQ